MQVRDVMTRDVVTVRPQTSAKQAGAVLAERGFAALPVVDDDGAVIGMVAEADVLRDRLPQDPRLHLLRETATDRPPSLLVRTVMTAPARTVPVTADIADVARLLVDAQLRSAPVVDGERLAGIVSRRDLLRALVRPDADIRSDVRRLIEAYTGEIGAWTVAVSDGVVVIERCASTAAEPADRRAVEILARTVPGAVSVQVRADAPTVDEPV